MKQVFQNLATGETCLEEVPCPKPQRGHALVKSRKSLVSVGTERMLVDFSKAGFIEKARSQPEKVKMVVDKVKTDGLIATYTSVKSKLDQPIPLGYCNVGTVMEEDNSGFAVGARVVSNGPHAEVIRVSKTLMAEVPDEVDDETAAFTVLGAIALQGIRLVNPTIGETVVVTGLGVIGLLAVQLLRANGCRVLGIDIDPSKCSLAKAFGAEVVDLSKNESPLTEAAAFSKGRGVDAVVITASSNSSDIVHQAATICRKRGRIVLVGVVGLELNRSDFYEKELTFQVSCSYGPGRYDSNYEERGLDYPFGFVRWTEQRNFEAVLELMASGAIDVKPLLTHRYTLDNALDAYETLQNSSALGVLIEYDDTSQEVLKRNKVELSAESIRHGRKGGIAFIGGGNYASSILIPAFKNARANLFTLVTSMGVNSVYHGKKHGFRAASTDISDALGTEIDAVVIATRHNLHASQSIQALKANKHVFVEKPLALTHEEIDQIEAAQKESGTMIMVGYNRRFSPLIKKMKSLLDQTRAPKTFIMTMNAGHIPSTHWVQDSTVGGGRILGEACHYIDLMRFLAGSKIKSFSAMKIGDNDFTETTEDKASISLSFENGCIGSIHYFANGDKTFPKERIEVFCDNAVLQLDNFKKLRGYGWKGFKYMSRWRQNKGQEECVTKFMESVREDKNELIPQSEIFEVARATIDIAKILRQ